MELTLKRYKITPGYTLSRLSETGSRSLVDIEVVEPPIEGLSKQPLSTLNPGLYKLFLKARPEEVSIVPRFQKVAGKPFFFIEPCMNAFCLDGAQFSRQERVKFSTFFWAGRVQGLNLIPDKEAYDRLIYRLCIALKQKEKITVKIV